MTNERLKSLARSENEQENFELYPPGLGSIDRKALMLSQQIRNEMAYAEVGSDECVDALLTIFGVHILRNYSSIGKRAEKIYGGGLSPKNWSRLNDYIMANLSEKLTLEMMAEVVRLSPSHFSRAFKETVGQSPHRYILSMRLATARKLLLTVDEPLEQIAKLAGFADNSHMAAVMKRFWGITPSMVKKELRR